MVNKLNLLLTCCTLFILLISCNSTNNRIEQSNSNDINKNSSSTSSSSSSTSSSSEKQVITKAKPYSGSDNYILSSSTAIENSSKEIPSITSTIQQENITKQLDKLASYLFKNLSSYNYSMINQNINNDGFVISVTNKENVEKVIEAYGNTQVKIEYKQAKYSKGYINDVYKALKENPLIINNSNIETIQVLPESINIVIKNDYPELAQWLEQSEYKDFVKLNKNIIKTNPCI